MLGTVRTEYKQWMLFGLEGCARDQRQVEFLPGCPSGSMNRTPQPGTTGPNRKSLLLRVLVVVSRQTWGRLLKISVRLVGSSQVAITPLTFPN